MFGFGITVIPASEYYLTTKKKWNAIIFIKMIASLGHNGEWNKPSTKRPIPRVLTFMLELKIEKINKRKKSTSKSVWLQM